MYLTHNDALGVCELLDEIGDDAGVREQAFGHLQRHARGTRTSHAPNCFVDFKRVVCRQRCANIACAPSVSGAACQSIGNACVRVCVRARSRIDFAMIDPTVETNQSTKYIAKESHTSRTCVERRVLPDRRWHLSCAANALHSNVSRCTSLSVFSSTSSTNETTSTRFFFCRHLFSFVILF